MHGVLVIDKPPGLTSHDVVSRVRRALGESRIGHTGTLDPMATGVLPLVLGKATRLARFLSGSRKQYVAEITLGITTDTDDAEGQVTGGARHADPLAPLPDAEAIASALDAFHGEFEQTPPAYSAKKIAGVAAHRLARRGTPSVMQPVTVTVHALDLRSVEGAVVRLEMTVSAGFYVRSLARDLGRALGCGAHLSGLRRTRSGDFDIGEAIPLDDVSRDAEWLSSHLVPLDEMLPTCASVRLTKSGLERVTHGNPVGPDLVDVDTRPEREETLGPVRLVDAQNRLVAVAEPGPRRWPLHPSIVLT